MESKFQGILSTYVNKFDDEEPILKLLDLNQVSTHHKIECHDLKLSNKYYETTAHLFNYSTVPWDKVDGPAVISNCHAVIVYLQYENDIDLDQHCGKFENIVPRDEGPKLFICNNLSEDSASYTSIREWCIKHEFDMLIASQDDIKDEIINSLSAYKWPHRTNNIQPKSNSSNSNNKYDDPQLSGDLMKKLSDFDSLLGKLSAYRDQPELRGDPDDKNIEEIAEILSGLINEDVDDFLED